MMKEIIMFHFASCPYCRRADKFVEDAFAARPEYAGEIKITRIDERLNPEIADQYDYYYVPTFFYEGEKLHEGDISKKEVEELLEKVYRT